MNTIKFSKIKNPTSEQTDLRIKMITKEMIFDKSFQIYHPCNLNIFLTEECQNQCYYCINGGSKKEYMKDEIYIDKLESCLKGLSGLPIEITITGGEPTLFPERLIKVMQLCKQYGFHCRTFSTTGFNLESTINNKPICQHMLENDFTHNINISRMHYDEMKNIELFGGKNISNYELSKLAMFFKMNNMDMRVSCNIIKNYIDSMEKILEFVEQMNSLGVEAIMFRELLGKDVILLSNILNFSDFQFLDSWQGLTYETDIYSYGEWLVKHYKTKKSGSNILTSMSFKNGILRVGFSDEIIKEF